MDYSLPETAGKHSVIYEDGGLGPQNDLQVWPANDGEPTLNGWNSS